MPTNKRRTTCYASGLGLSGSIESTGPVQQRRPGAPSRARAASGNLRALPGEPFGTQSEAAWEKSQRLLVDYRAIKNTRPVGDYFTNRFIQ